MGICPGAEACLADGERHVGSVEKSGDARDAAERAHRHRRQRQVRGIHASRWPSPAAAAARRAASAASPRSSRCRRRAPASRGYGPSSTSLAGVSSKLCIASSTRAPHSRGDRHQRVEKRRSFASSRSTMSIVRVRSTASISSRRVAWPAILSAAFLLDAERENDRGIAGDRGAALRRRARARRRWPRGSSRHATRSSPAGVAQRRSPDRSSEREIGRNKWNTEQRCGAAVLEAAHAQRRT